MVRADDAPARIAALQALLRDAAQDGFAGLERGESGLGSRLRVAADRVVSAWSAGAGPGQSALVAWRAELGEFESLERDTQVVIVARGVRLCFALGAGGGERPAASPLHAPAGSLPGIGPVTAARLGERGLHTVEDLIWFVPDFWAEFIDSHGRPVQWPVGLDLSPAPSWVRQLTERGLWLEQEVIVLDHRMGEGLETARAAPNHPKR